MKHLKLFENFESIERNWRIEAICKKYNINNYTINEDGSVDVDGNVSMFPVKSDKLPLKFRSVNGYFNCSYNELTSLEGCPISVTGNFNCQNNKLKSLEGSPQTVGGDFNCYNNGLTSLKGGPISVEGDFNCYNNELTSLEGCPKIGDNLNCNGNKLTSLEFCQSVNILNCNDNQLTSLEGCPEDLTGFTCGGNPVSEVWNLFRKVEDIEYFNYCHPIQDGVINLNRLNTFLEDTKRPTVTSVYGYKCI